MNYIKNEKLKTILEEFKGNRVNEKGIFENEYSPFENSFAKFIKWQKERKQIKKDKKLVQFEAEVKDGNWFFSNTDDAILWLGHASFLIRVNKIVLLTDPIFFSPSFLMKRMSKLPIDLNKLSNVNYLLISHDHRDHIDKKSLQLVCKQNPNIEIFTGLKLADLLQTIVPKNITIQEAGWYQKYNTVNNNFALYYLPARHWGRRNLNDTNKRLWGSFMIEINGKFIYFGADSGYDKHFAKIKTLFPNIDIALLGIGAYKPEWFMEQSHTSPEKALLAAQDLGCKTLIPMHYNTFDLSDEFMDEPLKEINHSYKKSDLKFNLKSLVIGEEFKI
jgi:L-ascorbate metabolism protein UlaG (beta-lactamase superfamily)